MAYTNNLSEDRVKSILNRVTVDAEGLCDQVSFQFSKIRVNKLTPELIHATPVTFRGVSASLYKLASVNVVTPSRLKVSPFEKNAMPEIEKALNKQNPYNLAIHSQDDAIFVSSPPMSLETRMIFVKQLADQSEAAKVSLRDIRKKAKEEIERLKKNGVSEDDVEKGVKALQVIVDNTTARINEMEQDKKRDLVTS